MISLPVCISSNATRLLGIVCLSMLLGACDSGAENYDGGTENNNGNGGISGGNTSITDSADLSLTPQSTKNFASS